jgi:hypothetical protein
MIKKISALFLSCAFLLNGFGMVFAAPETNKSTVQTVPLAALLPASDGVVTVNMRRALSEALPQVLASNPTMLNKILGEFDQIKNETGLDLRQFDQIAVGVSTKKISAKDTTFEPIILARGTFNSGALLALAKVAAKGKYREEKISGKTAYVFSAKQAIAQAKSKTTDPKGSVFEKTVDNMFKGFSDEIAVTAYDTNTLAIGSVLRVRETFDTKTRVGTDVLDLVNRKPNSIMSFGIKLPAGLSQFVDLDNDEIGKNLEAIRQIFGSVDVGGGLATVSLTARTLEAAQAKTLHETLEGLQMIGKAFIGGGKGADKKVYARMIENAKISQSGNEVMLDLQVAQSDIDILISAK